MGAILFCYNNTKHSDISHCFMCIDAFFSRKFNVKNENSFVWAYCIQDAKCAFVYYYKYEQGMTRKEWTYTITITIGGGRSLARAHTNTWTLWNNIKCSLLLSFECSTKAKAKPERELLQTVSYVYTNIHRNHVTDIFYKQFSLLSFRFQGKFYSLSFSISQFRTAHAIEFKIVHNPFPLTHFKYILHIHFWGKTQWHDDKTKFHFWSGNINKMDKIVVQIHKTHLKSMGCGGKLQWDSFYLCTKRKQNTQTIPKSNGGGWKNVCECHESNDVGNTDRYRKFSNFDDICTKRKLYIEKMQTLNSNPYSLDSKFLPNVSL